MRVGVRWYLAMLVGVPLLAAVPAVLMVRSARVTAYDPSIYGSAIEYGYHSEGRDADLVIFGDSSALYGVNPRLLGERLGISAINLPETIGVLTVAKDLMLEHYLANNKRPKLVVFYFTAWDLNYSNNKREGFLFEGEEMLVRHGSWPQRWAFASRHPSEAGMFPFRYYGAMIGNWPLHYEARAQREAAVRATGGHLEHDAHAPVLPGDCEIPDWLTVPVGEDSVRELREKYERRGYRVLVYVAPVPACQGAETLTSRSYATAGAKTPKVLPPGDFADDGSYAHMSRAAAGDATQALGDAVAAALK